jgi:hypothetical protein
MVNLRFLNGIWHTGLRSSLIHLTLDDPNDIFLFQYIYLHSIGQSFLEVCDEELFIFLP